MQTVIITCLFNFNQCYLWARVIIIEGTMHSKQHNIIIPSEPEYEVQQILGRKNTKTGLKYLIKWKGYEDQQATWQPVSNLLNSIRIVKQYEKNLKLAGGGDQSDDDGSNNSGERPGKKKRIFKAHLIFPKNKNIKAESKKESQKDSDKNSDKIVNKKNVNQQAKGSTQIDDEIGEQFCILISDEPESQLNNLNKSNKGEKQKESEKQVDRNPSQQYPFESSSNRPRSGSSRSHSHSRAGGDHQIHPPSLSLTQLQNQQNQLLILQNLNPSTKPKTQKKLIRLQTPLKQAPILSGEEKELRHPELKIVKIINSNGEWIAEVAVRDRKLGYVRVEVLQKYHYRLMLDYLYDLMQK